MTFSAEKEPIFGMIFRTVTGKIAAYHTVYNFYITQYTCSLVQSEALICHGELCGYLLQMAS